MKLFVWKNVLCDYTCGMVCILAHDLDEALRIYEEGGEGSRYEKLGSPTEVVDPTNGKPACFVVWGGG